MSIKKFELTTNTKVFLGKKLFRSKRWCLSGMLRLENFGGYVEERELKS